MLSTMLIAVFGVLAASVLRGFTGFGFGLAAVPLLSLALPPAKVVPLVVALQAIVGVGGFRGAWKQCDWRAVRGLTPGLAVGVPTGLLVLTAFQPNSVRLAIGVSIALSVLLLWRGVRLPQQPSRALTILTGVVSGVMSGLASMGGPPIIVYLLALGHGAAIVRATSIIYFMLSSLVALVGMSARGLLDREVLLWSVASVPVLFVGSWIGTWAFRRARPHHHRMTALVVLSILSAMLIVRALLPT
jgi:uncharacterized membrane protein YfcA